jgi:hypothetical protein
MLPTPNYILTEQVTIGNGFSDPKILPAGTFVRPIDKRWVPKHVLDSNMWFNDKVEVFCYTRFGIVPIAQKMLRRTG